jgi:hypothetical protein
LLVETDIILAHVKERDWLKPYAEAPLKAAERGEVELYASCEVLHERALKRMAPRDLALPL